MKYNQIYITNLPSFYKISLWNKVAEKKKILTIFTGIATEIRNEDFFKGEKNFDFVQLNGSLFKQTIQLIRILTTTKFDELFIGGWDGIPYLLASILSSKKKNRAIIESSIFESNINGWKSFIKKFFLRHITKVIVPGIAQKELVVSLNFKGEIMISGGCGLLNYIKQPPYIRREKVSNFLYVGRLAEEKNLELLISTFNNLPNLTLTIIGFGPLETQLKKIASKNTQFLGAVSNSELSQHYQNNDVFILPSNRETWGLVVEEALNNGIPIIASNKVGCYKDLIGEKYGLIFMWNSSESLKKSILKMTDIEFYNELRKNIATLDFIKRGNKQIETYLN